jgi:hypothetical protein
MEKLSQGKTVLIHSSICKVVQVALTSVPLQHIQKFARKCYRYIGAYRICDEDGKQINPKSGREGRQKV